MLCERSIREAWLYLSKDCSVWQCFSSSHNVTAGAITAGAITEIEMVQLVGLVVVWQALCPTGLHKICLAWETRLGPSWCLWVGGRGEYL